MTTLHEQSQLEEHDGDQVVLVGTYHEIDVRDEPTPPPIYRGHAGITLPDGTLIMLGARGSDDALRAERERTAFRRRKVEVRGTLHVGSAQWPGPNDTGWVEPVDDVRLST